MVGCWIQSKTFWWKNILHEVCTVLEVTLTLNDSDPTTKLRMLEWGSRNSFSFVLIVWIQYWSESLPQCAWSFILLIRSSIPAGCTLDWCSTLCFSGDFCALVDPFTKKRVTHAWFCITPVETPILYHIIAFNTSNITIWPSAANGRRQHVRQLWLRRRNSQPCNCIVQIHPFYIVLIPDCDPALHPSVVSPLVKSVFEPIPLGKLQKTPGVGLVPASPWAHLQ